MKIASRLFLVLCWWSVINLAVVVDCLSIPVAKNIRVETAPIIGGPTWLPVHVKVVVDEQSIFDYIPINATSPDTLQNLLSLRAVPAQARIKILSPNNKPISPATQRASQFCNNYSKQLHLINNNCWIFAYELIQYLLHPNDE